MPFYAEDTLLKLGTNSAGVEHEWFQLQQQKTAMPLEAPDGDFNSFSHWCMGSSGEFTVPLPLNRWQFPLPLPTWFCSFIEQKACY